MPNDKFIYYVQERSQPTGLFSFYAYFAIYLLVPLQLLSTFHMLTIFDFMYTVCMLSCVGRPDKAKVFYNREIECNL